MAGRQPGRREHLPGSPAALSVTADPSNLAAGTYTGSLTIQSNGGGTVKIPVNMAISSLTKALLLTQTGMSFTGVAQGGVVPPQSFAVVNPGTGSLAWAASVSTLAGGNWLSATPAAGSSNANQAAPQVTVSVNANGLAAGDYYGLVRIDAPGAANTPQVLTVFLTVLPAGSDPGASVQPSELFFTATPGGTSSPGSQQVLLYNIGAAPQIILYGAAPAHFAIAELPDAAAPRSGPADVRLLQPYGNSRPEHSAIVVNFQFSDGRVQTVKVNVIAAAAPGRAPKAISGSRDGFAAVRSHETHSRPHHARPGLRRPRRLAGGAFRANRWTIAAIRKRRGA